LARLLRLGTRIRLGLGLGWMGLGLGARLGLGLGLALLGILLGTRLGILERLVVESLLVRPLRLLPVLLQRTL